MGHASTPAPDAAPETAHETVLDLAAEPGGTAAPARPAVTAPSWRIDHQALRRCRLCWRIAVLVVGAILTIEAAILVPVYWLYRHDQLEQLADRGLDAIAGVLRTVPAGADLGEAEYAAWEPLLIGTARLRGVAFHRPDGTLARHLGEATSLRPHAGDGQTYDISVDVGELDLGERFETLWPAAMTGLRYTVTARLDSAWLSRAMFDFVLRVTAMILVVAVVATGATMVILGSMVLRPLLRLRVNLIAAGRDPDHPERYILPQPAQDELGDVVASFNGLLHTVSDALAAQRRAAAVQRELLEAIPIPLVVSVRRGVAVLHINGPALQLFGVGRDALFGCRVLDYFADPADRVRLRERLDAEGKVDEFELRLATADGEPLWALMSARLLTYQGQEALLAAFTPIAERKRIEAELVAARDAAEQACAELREAQESLVQAETMASLGGLVAGVAHEINTPIGIGLTAATHLAERTGPVRTAFAEGQIRKSELTRYLDLVAETCGLMVSNMERAAELIQGFKQVAVDQTSAERRRFRLGAYLNEVLLSLSPTLRRTALTTEVRCPADLEIDGYPGALSQLVTNFVMNSVMHAYDEGQAGRLTFEVEPIEGGDWVELRYSDDGKGIPAEIVPRVFEPFFTTRRGSGGSGLGLHIAFNLVTQTLGGRIKVASQPGAGTTFTLRFPRRMPADGP